MNAISAARRARRLSLEDISRTTRLSVRFIEAIDEGRFAELPGGLYARAYIRAVGRAVQLDTAEIEEVIASLAPPPDPLPALQEVHNEEKPGRINLPQEARLYAAATVDALILLVVNALIVTVVARACGLRAATLLSMAPMPLFVLCASTWVFYFILLGGVQGQTPGQQTFGVTLRRDSAPLRVRTILQRAAGLGALRALLLPAEAGDASPRFDQPPHAHGAQ